MPRQRQPEGKPLKVKALPRLRASSTSQIHPINSLDWHIHAKLFKVVAEGALCNGLPPSYDRDQPRVRAAGDHRPLSPKTRKVHE